MLTRSRSGEVGCSVNMSMQDVLDKLSKLQLDITSMKDDVSVIPAMNERMGLIEKRLDDLETVKTDVNVLKDNYAILHTTVNNVKHKVEGMTTVKQEYIDAMDKYRVYMLLNEKLNKRWNIILEGVEQDKNEDGSLKWESRPDAVEKVENFLRDILKIKDVITITDAHRMSVKTARQGRPLPLIFKLSSLVDKGKIYKSLKELKSYNENRGNNKVFVTMEHLPEQMQKDRKSLLDKFKDARRNGLKPTWFANRVTGQYCLKVGEVIHTPVHASASEHI